MSGSISIRRRARRGARVRAGRALVVAVAIACLLLAAAVAAVGASAAGKTEGWTRVVARGLTDPNNTYAPFYARFNDHLYLSTIASPGTTMYSGSDKVGGEIWRTADGIKWERIGRPGLGDRSNVAFALVVFRDRLYAVSTNTEAGLQIWVSSDGLRFTQLDTSTLSDKHDSGANPFVYRDRLILGVTNSVDGAQIWVSDDGVSLKAVVTKGMGDRDNNGIQVWGDPQEPGPVFRDELYAGVSNATAGGEIWRTADGLQWERAPDKGLGRGAKSVIFPNVVFQDRLYAVRIIAGTLNDIRGLDVYRTGDGATWEKVVSEGFGVGPERNATGFLNEFNGDIFLTASTYDPRVLLPGRPTERRAPHGFQLWRSSDGLKWKQVGEDGFGGDSTYAVMALDVIGDSAYLAAFDYRRGDQLWRSTNGMDWRLMFQQPKPSWYGEGGGPLEYQGHLLMIDNDLKRGVEIWRTDAVVVAQGMTTSPSPSASPAGGNGGAGGAAGEDGGATSKGGGLSGAWLVTIIAVVGALAVGIAAFAFARARARRPGTAGHAQTAEAVVLDGVEGAAQVTVETGAAAADGASTAAHAAPASRSFCSTCGSALDSDARFCANCGRSVPGSV